jgi:cytochrome c peroxidase
MPRRSASATDLFFEPRLSANGRVACATCHHPRKAFRTVAPPARGLADGTRNTPGLFNVRHQRWFGWDGGHDNLWSASLRPILDPREMGGSAARTAQVLRGCRPGLPLHGRPSARRRRPAIPTCWSMSPRPLPLAGNPGLAAHCLRSLSRCAGARGCRGRGSLSGGGEAGTEIFLGRGQCATCHAGPLFTNGEFGDIGVPFFIRPAGVDPGRQGGIKRLLANPYNLLGTYNDDATRDNATGTKFLRPEHRNFGEFKVPTLRNLTLTAPYMHNGSLATLRDVVRHYSELDEDRLHADGERILKPLA